MRKTNNQIARVPSLYFPCDSELSVEQWILVNSLESVFFSPFLIFSPIVVSCHLWWTPTHTQKPSSHVFSSLEPFWVFLFPLPGRTNPSFLSTWNKYVILPQLVGLPISPLDQGSANCLMTHIWPVACFCTVCELRIDFTFRMIEKKKRICYDVKILWDSITYCLWLPLQYNGRNELLWQTHHTRSLQSIKYLLSGPL